MIVEIYVEFSPGVYGDWRLLRKEIPCLHIPTRLHIDGMVFDIDDVIYDADKDEHILYIEDSPRKNSDDDDMRLRFVNDFISKGWKDITDIS